VLRLYNLDADPRWNLVVLAVLAVFYRAVAVAVKISRMEWKWRLGKDIVWRSRKPGTLGMVQWVDLSCMVGHDWILDKIIWTATTN